MKFIEPRVEYWHQKPGINGIWEQIAKATRVCYQSTPKNNGESDEDFVKRVILKRALVKGDLNDLEHCEFDFDKMHGSVLEHGTVYLDVPYNIINPQWFVEDNYSKISSIDNHHYITTNMRDILENHNLSLFKFITFPNKSHHKRYTFSIISNIGVTREANRHRKDSPSEESTRYCTYSARKFNGEITYVYQHWIGDMYEVMSTKVNQLDENQQLASFKNWCKMIAEDDILTWTKESFLAFALKAAEFSYMNMKELGATNDEARTVLNLGTKTQEVITAFDEDWEHFLKLRSNQVSGHVHPDMKVIADTISNIYNSIKNG